MPARLELCQGFPFPFSSRLSISTWPLPRRANNAAVRKPFMIQFAAADVQLGAGRNIRKEHLGRLDGALSVRGDLGRVKKN